MSLDSPFVAYTKHMFAYDVAHLIGPDKLMFSITLSLYSYPTVSTCVVGAEENPLIETVLLSTHNICFD